METYEIKRWIKSKNKILFKILKKIYIPIKNIIEIPIEIREYKRTITQIEQNRAKGKKALYVGIPLHANLGDQAQYFCIKEWMNENYSDIGIIEIADCIINSNFLNINSKIKKIITKKDIILFQSGYRTTDVANIYGEKAHRKILNLFPENNVLVFPQTVNFKKENEIQESINAYTKNHNVLFLARDEVSYKTARNMYTEARIELYPDIVTSLIGKYKFNNKRDGILCCTRRDNEKYYNNSELEKMILKLKKIAKVDRNDTTIDISYMDLEKNLEKILRDTFQDFSKYKLIITDRYHGTIFSLIASTPVIVLNSTDHKLSSGVNWFVNLKEFENYIFFANSLEEAYELARKIYNEDSLEYKLPEYFSEKYYNTLQEKFEKLQEEK